MLSKENKDFIVGLLIFFIVASVLNFGVEIALLPAVIAALAVAIPSALIFEKLAS